MATVLVVDDEPDIVLLVRLALESAGHEVVEAGDGAAALDAVAERDPDVMLLDLRMAPVDGWAVLDRLRADGRLASLPVVVVSAHASPAATDKALRAGCRAYLNKPFTIPELLACVEDALQADARPPR